MKEKSKETVTIENHAQGELREIPVDDITTEGQNVRALMDDDHVVELSMSMAGNGLMNPITVRKTNNHKHQLIAGAHRLAAAMRLKWATIPAIVRAESDVPVRLQALMENVVRKDLTLQEEIIAVDHLYAVEKLSPSRICELTGKSRAWVDKRLAAKTLPEKVRIALFDGLISLGAAELIGSMEDEGLRNQLLNQSIYSKYTTSQIAEILDIYKNTPSLAAAIQCGVKAASEIQTPKQAVRNCAACGRERNVEDMKAIMVCGNGCCPAPEKETKNEETDTH
jgi:ParB family chromosome partitioning protein